MDSDERIRIYLKIQEEQKRESLKRIKERDPLVYLLIKSANVFPVIVFLVVITFIIMHFLGG